MPPTAPPRHVTSSGDDAVSPRQPPPPSPPASDDVASPREQPPPPSEAPESEADTATSAPPMRGPPPIQPRAPPSGGGGGPPSSAPPSRPPPSAPLPGGSMTMRRGPPPAVPSAGGGEFSSMTMPRQRSTTDSPAPASRSSAALSPPTLLAASPGGGGPPPVAPRKGSGAAMLGSSVAVQSVPVRRDIPAIEISKGGKNDLQGGWAVVGDQNVAKKKYMEDAFVMLPDFMPNAAYFAVYDGHEGREAVDYVRTKLHEHLRDSLNEGKTVFEAFEASYRRCDADLCALEVRKSGTTAVSVLIRKEGKNRVLYVANVGDSRATLCNKGKGERLSYDHKASDPAENKRVTDLGATVLWDKVQGQLSVTRALGDHDLKQYVSCEPHFATMTLAKEHKFLVVACDGIWDVTDDQTAVDVLEKAGKEPVAKAKRLIEYVIEKGTTDNLTAAFISLQV
jgi:serine/threonine protein phosphatase PrpC